MRQEAVISYVLQRIVRIPMCDINIIQEQIHGGGRASEGKSAGTSAINAQFLLQIHNKQMLRIENEYQLDAEIRNRPGIEKTKTLHILCASFNHFRDISIFNV